MDCPLCASPTTRPSWIGTTIFEGREFHFSECVACQSSFCDPMPDDATLQIMYGPRYLSEFSPVENIVHPRDIPRIVRSLANREPGSFIDYGCGQGEVLSQVRRSGWKVTGVEFDK